MDWQAVGVILTGFGLIGGLLGFFFKNLIDRRFMVLETSLQHQAKTTNDLQVAFQKIQWEMPAIYVKSSECARCKEDWTYLQSIIDAKLDILKRGMNRLRRDFNDRKKPE